MQAPLAMAAEGMAGLLHALLARGFEVVGPRRRDGVVELGPLSSAADLPAGLSSEQAPGRYRLLPRGDGAVLAHGPAAQGWRRFLQPPRERFLAASRRGRSLHVRSQAHPPPRMAFLGVRPCDLAALAALDGALLGAPADPRYAARRAGLFLVAAACVEPGGTCFCASLGTGPGARGGFDLCLTEILEGERRFLVEVGSDAGAALAQEMGLLRAPVEDRVAAARAVAGCARAQARALDLGAAALVGRSLSSPAWEAVARRCLSCGACTMVCPTCFCTTAEDELSLDRRACSRSCRWDSCFALGHSYVHGGPVRATLAARHRQWVAHKLLWQREQHGAPGCTGCGRCITWCPAGIDLTETVAALGRAEASGGGP
ncbi:MAG TPA: 4Fe-4S dicluster domain-containing protein [Anaeromyxobacteraceae bacterium]|nr:4Fe-4S dicluster domain-containing protein [Anaeromyxobacteraceae bacterium]